MCTIIHVPEDELDSKTWKTVSHLTWSVKNFEMISSDRGKNKT